MNRTIGNKLNKTQHFLDFCCLSNQFYCSVGSWSKTETLQIFQKLSFSQYWEVNIRGETDTFSAQSALYLSPFSSSIHNHSIMCRLKTLGSSISQWAGNAKLLLFRGIINYVKLLMEKYHLDFIQLIHYINSIFTLLKTTSSTNVYVNLLDTL